MGVGQAEDAEEGVEEEGVIEEECEEVEEEEEVGCSSLVNCGQCISHPGCVFCRDPEFSLQERSTLILHLIIIPHPTLCHLQALNFHDARVLIVVHAICATNSMYDELPAPLDHEMQIIKCGLTRCGTPEFFLLPNSSCSLFEDPQNYWQEVRNQVRTIVICKI